jgi:hypothetical protein
VKEEPKKPEVVEVEQIESEATNLLTNFFNNQELQEQIKEKHPEEAAIQRKLRLLAEKMALEAPK